MIHVRPVILMAWAIALAACWTPIGAPSTAPHPGPPQEAEPGQRRWPIFGGRIGGALLGDIKTEFRLASASLGRGTDITLEDDLGFDSNAQVGRFDAFYRFNRKNRILPHPELRPRNARQTELRRRRT